MAYDMKIEILRHPEKEDWERCKMLALNTVGKKYAGTETTDNWKRQILKAEHSPIRTLMFTIRLTIPYFVSVHLVRHKIGIEHYVQSQRNDRQTNYDRELAPQNAMVSHIIEVNAEQLMFMARRRLCGQADATTRFVMTHICIEVCKTNPEFKDFLKPMCEYRHECPEFKSCGYYKEHNNDWQERYYELDAGHSRLFKDFCKLQKENEQLRAQVAQMRKESNLK